MASLKKILEGFSLTGDLTTLVLAIITTDSLCSFFNSPYFIAFFISMAITIIIFFIPRIWQHFRQNGNLIYEILSYLGIVFLFLIFGLLWNSYRKCCNQKTSQSALVAKDTSLSKRLVIHDTVLKPVYVPKDKTTKKEGSQIKQKNEKGDNIANTGTNNGNMGGKNNTTGKNVVNGPNYGNNGDTYNNTTTSPVISPKTLDSIGRVVLNLLKTNDIKDDIVAIVTLNNSNAGDIPYKIRDYLRVKGFNVAEDVNMLFANDYTNPYTISIEQYQPGMPIDKTKFKFIKIIVGFIK